MPEETTAPDDTQPPATPPSPEQRLAELEAKLLQAETALADERDKFLRRAAEFENIRRRLAAESQRAADAKKIDFIQQALAIADNLAIALLTPADKETVEHLGQGVRLTLEKFNQLLREHGVEKFESLDRPFDPNLHEAVATQKNPDRPENTVLQVFREGYMRGEQVLRHAQVVVNQP